MALFNRKKADQTVLPEIERYYDAEKRERTGLAWLLAVASIAAVALVLIGAFFGGRWVYRKATHTNKTTGVSTTETNTGGNIGKSKDETDSTIGSPAAQTPAAKPIPAPTTPKPSNTPAPTPAPTTPASSNLANTGPESVVPYFALATIFGTLFYRFKLRKTS